MGQSYAPPVPAALSSARLHHSRPRRLRAHMPVTSMVKLARVDFETSDPAQLRAATRVLRRLQPRPNGRWRRIAVRVGRAPEEARECALRELPAPPELAREAGADSRVLAYRIDDADLPRLAAFRTELIAKKSS